MPAPESISITLEAEVMPASLSLPLRVRLQGVDAVLISAAEFARLTGTAVRGQTRSTAAPLRVTQWEEDGELAAFVRERLGTMPQSRILREIEGRFGPDRTPTKSALCRFVARWKAQRARSGEPATEGR